MFTVKDLGEPGWPSVPLVAKGSRVVRSDGWVVASLEDAPGQEDEEADALATLFAAAPELAGVVREYLEGLEDKVTQAERQVQGSRELVRLGQAPHSVVTARMVDETDARRVLAAASPLYAALAKAYGKKGV